MKPRTLSQQRLLEVHQKWFSRDGIRQEYDEYQKQRQSGEPCIAPTQGCSFRLRAAKAHSRKKKKEKGDSQW